MVVMTGKTSTRTPGHVAVLAVLFVFSWLMAMHTIHGLTNIPDIA